MGKTLLWRGEGGAGDGKLGNISTSVNFMNKLHRNTDVYPPVKTFNRYELCTVGEEETVIAPSYYCLLLL